VALLAPSPILSLIAFMCATIAPIALAVAFGRYATRMRSPWIAHLFFLPCLLSSEWALLWLTFYAANDDGDGPPGLGFALLPAFGIFVITVIAYYAIAYANRQNA
jgi:FtsH-binding integral membrane protein